MMRKPTATAFIGLGEEPEDNHAITAHITTTYRQQIHANGSGWTIRVNNKPRHGKHQALGLVMLVSLANAASTR
jgi:hypothetical protein